MVDTIYLQWSEDMGIHVELRLPEFEFINGDVRVWQQSTQRTHGVRLSESAEGEILYKSTVSNFLPIWTTTIHRHVS